MDFEFLGHFCLIVIGYIIISVVVVAVTFYVKYNRQDKED